MEVDTGVPQGITTSEVQRIKGFARENKERRRANEILKLSARFSPRRRSTPPEVLKGFIDQHRGTFWAEPICKVLQVALSAYGRHAALLREPRRRRARALREEVLEPEIQRVWQANMQVCGADKVWRQLAVVARCTGERLMQRLGLRGVRRGKWCAPPSVAALPLR